MPGGVRTIPALGRGWTCPVSAAMTDMKQSHIKSVVKIIRIIYFISGGENN
jgi:hypothetical protein